MNSPRFGFVEVSVDPTQAIVDGVAAEKAGFDAVWIPDHITDVNGDKLEPWTVLSAIAVQTKKIELGSSVADTQRAHPSRTAHATACLDVISRGRVLVGIGAGEAMNVVPFGLPWEDPAGRTRRLEEAVRVMKILWGSRREDLVSFTGDYYTLKDAFLSLGSYRKPHPPVYVGAMGSRRMLEVAGRQGEGWYSWFNTPELFKKKWGIVKDAAEAVGRSARKIEPCSHLMVALPRDSEERKAAMLGAKSTLLMEKRTLESMGYTNHLDFMQYQNFTISIDYVKKIFKAAEEIPDEYVHRVMAVGDVGDIRAQIEILSKAGVKHLAVADFLAPKSTKRTLRAFSKLIAEYR